ncbi:MAG: NAD(P)-dependent oxidoreductase [Desulfobulbaceae bacterium]|nr:NAD(P)-dependent oxidoreductase [Desulfobulbaceae bacterium]HIJ89249.1 NAD(P)-dependent oxidoreductase [Deltaproteobacteria bacterium]
MTPVAAEKTGVLVGGSGLLGGTLLYYFKTQTEGRISVLAPNSKKLSLRDPDDIRRYFEKAKPAFIINCAIAAIDSDPHLAYEINYLGTVYLAKAAQELGIPYIHLSSAAVMPIGRNLDEEKRLPLRPDLPNYTKAKLMAELTLEHLRRVKGLDYTAIRLGIVYGAHDHKIQGFQRLFFAIIDRSMPMLFTRRDALHSYSNAKKLPYFIAHLLENRAEFSGQIYNFVDPNPVLLSQLILTIKSYLELKTPREIYLPYPVAKFGMGIMARLVRMITRLGIDARMPAELMFLKNFYETQTLSAAKLRNSSFSDPDPGATIFSELPALIEYYVTRWEHLNLIEPFNKDFFDPRKRAEEFLRLPDLLLQEIHQESDLPFLKQCALVDQAPERKQP